MQQLLCFSLCRNQLDFDSVLPDVARIASEGIRMKLETLTFPVLCCWTPSNPLQFSNPYEAATPGSNRVSPFCPVWEVHIESAVAAMSNTIT